MNKLRLLILIGILLAAQNTLAEEDTGLENKEALVTLEEIKVTAEKIEISPNKTEVFLEDYNIAGHPGNVLDILKDRATIDFRGQSDLVPEPDIFQFRGFESRQFLVAVDGLVVQKTGGWWGDHYLDFAMIPLSTIESMELISGPHSALYDGKSFGGVINIKTKAPKYYEQADIQGSVTTGVKTYNTQTHGLDLQGGIKGFNLALGYERYSTHGYLRNNRAEIDAVTARLSYKLPSDGSIQFTGTYSDLNREIPSANDPARADYDNDYPVVKQGDVSKRWWDPAHNNKRNYAGHSLRFDFTQPSSWGIWMVRAYYTDERQAYHTDGPHDFSAYDTNYVSYGGLAKIVFELTKDHKITIGIDTAHLFQKYTEQIVETWAGYIQDQWNIFPSLTLTAGLRYEDIDIWWNNWDEEKGEIILPEHSSRYIKKTYHQLAPKSFLTYQMDGLARWLRDTSLSIGVSKIWTPRDYCEWCSWGSGVEVDPTHGIGYDLIFIRRLWRNICLNVDFSHYEFEDYGIWANAATDYFKDSPWKRRMVELSEVHKDGVDVEINGNIVNNLYFYVSYSYNDWEYEGPHRGGPEEWADQELGDRAKHRLNAGVRYNLFDDTLLLLDYKYQDEQVQQIIDIVGNDPSDLYVHEAALDSYHVFNFAVEQQLFQNWNNIRSPKLKLYVNNLFDENYSNNQGYPMTDRTYGCSLSFDF